MKDYLGREIQTVQRREKIENIFYIFDQDTLDFIVVLDEVNIPVGIISTQMKSTFQKDWDDYKDREVGEFSSKNYILLSKEDTIEKAIEYYEKPILIIDSDNQFAGILDKSKMIKDYFQKQQFLTNELEAILDFAHEGIVVVDKKGNITLMNEPYADFLGVNKEDMIGKHVTEVIDGTRLHIVVETGKQEIGDIQRVRGKNIVVMRMPIFKNGKVSGAIGKIMFKDPKEVGVLASKITKIEKELNYYKDALKQASSARYSFNSIIGSSEKLQESKYLAEKAAHTNSNVLIRGESGTGKELFAHAIHSYSHRAPKPFVKINCAAIPAELLESELFGYEEGAFTGARRGGKIGKFESAHGGSVFLDEIGDMPLAMQAKLLRVLQEKEIERVGGIKNIEVDVRIIAATHRNLEELVQKGEFREDLYYRLNVMNIQIPALRERPEDIPIIVQHLLEKISEQVGNYVAGISQEAMNRLYQYNWPGNVRELENVLERTIILVDYGKKIQEAHLPMYLRKMEKSHFSRRGKALKEILEDAERDAILDCLHQTGGNRSETAKILKMSRSSLYERLWKYGIE